MTKLSLKINRKYKKFSCNERRCLGLVIGLTGLLIREPKRFRSLLLIFSIFIFRVVFFPPSFLCLKSLPYLLPPKTGGQRKLLLIGSSGFFFLITTHWANYKFARTQKDAGELGQGFKLLPGATPPPPVPGLFVGRENRYVFNLIQSWKAHPSPKMLSPHSRFYFNFT